MNSNFCDRCGCQLRHDNFRYEGGKYIIKKVTDDTRIQYDRYGKYRNLGRELFLCNDCQKIVDQKLDEEFICHLPATVEVDIAYLKEEDDRN